MAIQQITFIDKTNFSHLFQYFEQNVIRNLQIKIRKWPVHFIVATDEGACEQDVKPRVR